MEKQKFYMPASLLIKILVCLAVIAAFWVAPPVAPLTAVGMRVIGIFIGVILMLSIVDTVWPAMLAIVLLALPGYLYLADPLIIKPKKQPKEA